MTNPMMGLLADESGATAVEYGLIAALVSVAALTAMQAMGSSLTTLFSSISSTLESALPGGGGGTP